MQRRGNDEKDHAGYGFGSLTSGSMCTSGSSRKLLFWVAQAGMPPGSTFVAPLATTLAEPSTAGSGVPLVAKQVGLANQVRNDVC